MLASLCEQVQEFGAGALAAEVAELRDVSRALKAACDPEGKEYWGAKFFLPSCKGKGGPGCHIDVAQTTACMLDHYDRCRSASVFSQEHRGKCEKFRHRATAPRASSRSSASASAAQSQGLA